MNLTKIQSNYLTIREAVSPAQVMAVLKANAYGLGLRAVAQCLVEVGVDRIGVASLDEAMQLASLPCPIQIIGAVLLEEVALCVENDIVIPISDRFILNRVIEMGIAYGKRPTVHVLLDTGMGRLGTVLEQASEFLSDVANCEGIYLEGVYSHFPSAYDDIEFSLKQIERFQRVLDMSKVMPPLRHIANSDGINNISTSIKKPFNLVRSGINLYGYFDTIGNRCLPLQPVVRLEAKLIAVRTLASGSTVGYGRTYRLACDQRIGTVAIGYADGLPMQLSESGVVEVRGVKCPIVGKVSMDYTTILLDTVPDARPGDMVLCLGPTLPPEVWAEKKGTIIYEIICALGQRVQRRYEA
ncbi:MAG: alanine racemase [Gammaproteobacteria bacterium]